MADEAGRVKLPTEEELATLPRWAIVAFAVRCAQRARPLLDAAWPEGAEKFAPAADTAISAARAASADVFSWTPARLRDATDRLVIGAMQADDHDAFIAGMAMRTIAEAAKCVFAGDAARTARFAARSSALAAQVGAMLAPFEDYLSRDAMAKDFARLQAVTEEHLGDGPERDPPALDYLVELGPLWPDGRPVGWPSSKQANSLRIRFNRNLDTPLGVDVLIDPGDATKEQITDVFLALSDLHRAVGGAGLVFNRRPSTVLEVTEEHA